MVQHFSCGLNVDFSSESQISKYIVEAFNDVFAHQVKVISEDAPLEGSEFFFVVFRRHILLFLGF